LSTPPCDPFPSSASLFCRRYRICCCRGCRRAGTPHHIPHLNPPLTLPSRPVVVCIHANNVCASQQAHVSTQDPHTTKRTTPTNFCVSLTNPSRRLAYDTARHRVPCRGLARCSGRDRDNGLAAAGRQQQPGHHTRKGLAVGEPRLGPAQVLVHDSRHPAGGDAGIFRLPLSISDLFPLPSLLGAHGFHIGNKGGAGPGLGQHTGGDGDGNGIRGGRRPGGMESSPRGSSPPEGADLPSALGRRWRRQRWRRQRKQE
jgi:hypothetical protein